MKIEEIMIIDIETDHLNHNIGSIVEIGIVKLNFNTGKIQRIFNFVIQENKLINSKAWIFKNSTLKEQDINLSASLEHFREFLQNLFNKYYFTAFNQKFDFTWLKSRGFKIPNKFLDPMLILTPIMQLQNYYGHSNFKFPKVTEAYFYLFKKKIVEEHRALPDAIIEAKILLKMYQNKILKQ